MTGFGRAEGVVAERKVSVEVRSLNSRQLDLQTRLPAVFKAHDTAVRQLVGERIVRGKAELAIVREPAAGHTGLLDHARVKAYHAEFSALAHALGVPATPELLTMALRMPDVLAPTTDEPAADEWPAVEALLAAALEDHDSFRRDEGARLATDLQGRVHAISALLAEVDGLDHGRAERARGRIRAKLDEAAIAVDHDRFEQELVHHLEKLDINEEKVRLAAHCAYFHETMAGDEHQGRKLGFIAQEMGREINTIGSKANDAAMQRVVVRMKDELEKIKEQVLNVL
ncbi:MAG: YicC/YloC family endoribonuclease [Flavobacteriales bacterium]|jgi:uncharacterized protein (TIGR00255 family)|nr:YicC/YloC family endoribonuclease [Flavobacteriales bacterium]